MKRFICLVIAAMLLAGAAFAQQKPAFRLGLSIGDASGAYWTTLMGGTQSATLTYTLPTAYPGASGYALTATTAGVMSWAALSAVADTATQYQMLQSGGVPGDPAYSTATWPATTTANQILYSSAANTVTGLATAASGVLVTDGAGIPSISATGGITGTHIADDTVDGVDLADSVLLDANQSFLGDVNFIVAKAALAEAGVEEGTGNVAVKRCLGGVCQVVLTLTAVEVTITDPGGAAGFGGIKLFNFPEGWVYRLGVVADLALTAGAGGIADDWDGDVALGGTVSGGGGLAADEVSWVPSTATPQAAAGVTTADCQSTATEHTIGDGHTAALDLFLNFEVDDADISAGDTIAVTGTITVTWIGLGDN